MLEPPPTTGLVGMVAAALRRVPYTFYAADVWSDATDSVEGVPTLVRGAVRWAERTVWRRAARVLTISPGVQHRLEELIGARDSLVMVGNGIDTDTFTPAGEDAGEQGPCFVYAGTVSEWQGAGVFVDAFARVRAEHPAARLLFFSEGSGRDELEARVRREGIEGIEFRDKIPPAQVAAQLRGAVAGLSSITPGQGYEFARRRRSTPPPPAAPRDPCGRAPRDRIATTPWAGPAATTPAVAEAMLRAAGRDRRGSSTCEVDPCPRLAGRPRPRTPSCERCPPPPDRPFRARRARPVLPGLGVSEARAPPARALAHQRGRDD